jgi:Tol biopolymer transport system component
VARNIATMPAPNPLLLGRYVRRMGWAADSKHVVVSVADRHGHGEGLLLISIADGERRWLTDPKPHENSADREPAVSPDGRLLAFARVESASFERIYLLPLTPDLHAAGVPQVLSAAGRSRSPAWSPDGKEILFTGVSPGTTDAGLSKLRLKDAEPVRIPAAGLAAAIPAVSRTGLVAFSVEKIESSIWRQEVPSQGRPVLPPVRLTKAATLDGDADYSPDGRHIVFASDRAGTRDIWTCDSEGAHCQALTSFGATYATGSPRWSPNGRQIAFNSGAAGRMHIYVVDANGGRPQRLTDDGTGGTVPRWSHNGEWIYFSSARSGANEILKIRSTGGAPVRVTRSGGLVVMEAPDASALFYTKTGEQADLFRSEINGSGEQLVLRGVARRGFVVTHDRVFYLHQDTDGFVSLRAFVLQTGEDMQIEHMAQPMFIGLGVSPDEHYLIYTQMRISSNLMLAEGVFR